MRQRVIALTQHTLLVTDNALPHVCVAQCHTLGDVVFQINPELLGSTIQSDPVP